MNAEIQKLNYKYSQIQLQIYDIEDELQNKRKAGARAEVAPLVTLMSAFDGALQVNFVTAHAPLTFPLHKYKMQNEKSNYKNIQYEIKYKINRK